MLKLDGMCIPYNDNTMGLWRNGSASDSRSEGWELESLWPQKIEREEVSWNIADSKGIEDVG